jgi:hypothetical protein
MTGALRLIAIIRHKIRSEVSIVAIQDRFASLCRERIALIRYVPSILAIAIFDSGSV